MLVLTRKPGESIVIGNEVTVTIIEMRNGQVRIGVEAPRSIEVHRQEIYDQVRQQNLAAVSQASRAADAVQRLKKG